MEKTVKMAYTGLAGAISVIAAWLFARLGVLLYVIITLAVMMCIDHLSEIGRAHV